MANSAPAHFELVMHSIAHMAYVYVAIHKIWRRFKRPKNFNPNKGRYG
jgi:hypothetical protein